VPRFEKLRETIQAEFLQIVAAKGKGFAEHPLYVWNVDVKAEPER
jgi:hypothetical protein